VISPSQNPQLKIVKFQMKTKTRIASVSALFFVLALKCIVCLGIGSPTSVAVLRGHTGHVKGVTWDPVGKYLASQSADKTLR